VWRNGWVVGIVLDEIACESELVNLDTKLRREAQEVTAKRVRNIRRSRGLRRHVSVIVLKALRQQLRRKRAHYIAGRLVSGNPLAQGVDQIHYEMSGILDEILGPSFKGLRCRSCAVC
jgi:hypothetical protein